MVQCGPSSGYSGNILVKREMIREDFLEEVTPDVGHEVGEGRLFQRNSVSRVTEVRYIWGVG